MIEPTCVIDGRPVRLTDWQADAELRGIAFDGVTRLGVSETRTIVLPTGVG